MVNRGTLAISYFTNSLQRRCNTFHVTLACIPCSSVFKLDAHRFPTCSSLQLMSDSDEEEFVSASEGEDNDEKEDDVSQVKLVKAVEDLKINVAGDAAAAESVEETNEDNEGSTTENTFLIVCSQKSRSWRKSRRRKILKRIQKMKLRRSREMITRKQVCQNKSRELLFLCSRGRDSSREGADCPGK